jgi:Tannase and feruloyl esterase
MTHTSSKALRCNPSQRVVTNQIRYVRKQEGCCQTMKTISISILCLCLVFSIGVYRLSQEVMLRYLDQLHWLCTYLLLSFTWALPREAEGAVTGTCTPAGIPFPEVFGAEILSLSASSVTNYSISLFQTDAHFPINLTGLDFCNVSIQYTHPGQNDRINVQVWLPLSQWNGRFMGTGGGGYATELAAWALPYAVSLGYSAVATDGGHLSDLSGDATWALISPGNVNWALLQDFAAIALDDAATIGKAITVAYYGSPPKYSYWNGCSTGGRQGLMMAQRYPSQYDGILAGAPAINWASIVVGVYWAQLIMNQLSMYVPSIFSDLKH